MTRADAIDGGRDALRRRAWADGFRLLSSADGEGALEPPDLEILAEAAHLLGRTVEGADFLTRAHRAFLERGDRMAAARCACWLAIRAQAGGEAAQASGWVARAERLLDGGPSDCSARGHLLALAAIRSFREGDVPTAHAAFVEVAAMGRRVGDPDLVAFGLCGQGRTLLRRGELRRGLPLLDEAMVAIQADEVSPHVVGGVYCTMLEACSEVFDLRRAQEWTDALVRWCTSQPDIVPYRGPCLAYRAQLLALHGAWEEALGEIERARGWLAHPRLAPALAAVLHVLGDIRRLRGEVTEAEEAYRTARIGERVPHPGFALLRLAQGQVEAARAAIRGAAQVIRDDAGRTGVLEAQVEVALGANDLPAAEQAAAELAAMAARVGAPFLRALAGRAAGAVLLAAGDARGALGPLREALAIWRELEAPYHAARTQVLLALACRADQDCDGAELELEGARGTFERLGAAPDLARVDALLRAPGRPNGLTAREVQVLAMVASGRTNRAIAGELGLSDKTVARHLSNIFAKLGISSRAAATAYAYEHELVGSPSARTQP
jgi:ATP/maltotriose-dependent transcriptional regulator MalT